MINLTKSDWAEIFNALLSKSTSATTAGDTKWINQLKRIMTKIGPDGSRAMKRGITKEDDWWTVVIDLPGEIADDIGAEHFISRVRSRNLLEAVDKARWDCKRYIKEPDLELDDLLIICVIKGNHKDHSVRWGKLQADKGYAARTKVA